MKTTPMEFGRYGVRIFFQPLEATTKEENQHPFFLRNLYDRKTMKVARTKYPAIIQVDQNGFPHKDDGPTVIYDDDKSIYMWHGWLVDPKWIEEKEKIGEKELLEEPNAEVRRLLWEIVGPERVLSMFKFKAVSEDKYGKLFKQRIKFEGEPEPMEMAIAEVTDKTEKLDGGFKTYYLHVDPTSKTCREAVGRTFLRDDWKKYKPEVET